MIKEIIVLLASLFLIFASYGKESWKLIKANLNNEKTIENEYENGLTCL